MAKPIPIRTWMAVSTKPGTWSQRYQSYKVNFFEAKRFEWANGESMWIHS